MCDLRLGLVTACFVPLVAGAAGLPLEGMVIGRDGMPPRTAVVQLEALAMQPFSFVAPKNPAEPVPAALVDAKGRFHAEVPGPGAWRVWFRSPLHHGDSIVLMIPEGTKALPRITARLRAAPPIEFFGSPKLIVKGENWKLREFVKEADGSWIYRGSSKEKVVHYLLELNGPRGRAWSTHPAAPAKFLDRTFYSSATTQSDGTYSIRFDPRDLEPEGSTEFSFELEGASPAIRRSARIADSFGRYSRGVYELHRTHPHSSDSQRELGLVELERLSKIARDPKEPRGSRELAAVLAIHLASVLNDGELDDFWKLLTPRSIAWSAYPPALSGAPCVRFSGDEEATKYLRQVAAEHPDHLVRGEALLALANMARDDHRDEEAHALFRRLSLEFADVPSVKRALSDAARKSAMAPGMTFPALRLTTLEGATLTQSSLRGRYTLIEFSMYGCSACLSAIPELQKLRKQVPVERLRMVTVTLTTTRELLSDVLARQPPQPWEHVPLPDDEASGKLLESHGVWAFPSMVLVGPDGRIVATDRVLRRTSEYATNVSMLIPPELDSKEHGSAAADG